MNKKVITLILVLLLVNVIFSPQVLAADEQKDSSELPSAFGVGFSGIGATGLFYKKYITDDTALQYSASIYGSSEDYLEYNFGLMYHKVLHKGNKTRLILAPGVLWEQQLDLNEEDDLGENKYNNMYYLNKYGAKSLSTGLTVGVEWKFSQIALEFCTGYKVSIYWENDYIKHDTKAGALNQKMDREIEFGPTGGFALSYYF